VLGVGFGLWWLARVSADILKDCIVNVYVAVRDLMAHCPIRRIALPFAFRTLFIGSIYLERYGIRALPQIMLLRVV
jgi:hypothetical protein